MDKNRVFTGENGLDGFISHILEPFLDAADVEAEQTPRLAPWSTVESPGMALCSARSLSGALVATSLSAIVMRFVCGFVGLSCREL